MTPRRIRRLGVRVVVASISGLLVALTGVLPAGASPITDKRAQAARIAQQIQAQGLKVERLAEALDQARLTTEALQAKIVVAEAQIAQTAARAAKVRGAVRAQAVTLFVTGGRAATMQAITQASPADIVITQAYLSRTFASEQDALDQMRSVGRQLTDQRAALDAERRKATDSMAKVSADRQAAAAAEAAQLAILGKLQGELGALVTAEQQRLAAIESARVQAELAARLASVAASRSRSTPPAQGLPGSGPSGPVPAPNGGAGAAVAAAQAQLGKPYVYGGAGPGSFDCSGLTRWAWMAGGVSLSHGATSQYFSTSHVPVSQAQPGDLVFYGSGGYMYHVGLYVGGGQMIEAENSGTVVHYASIYRSGLYPLVGRP